MLALPIMIVGWPFLLAGSIGLGLMAAGKKITEDSRLKPPSGPLPTLEEHIYEMQAQKRRLR